MHSPTLQASPSVLCPAGARRPSPAANLQRLLRVTNSALRRGLALGGLAAAFFGAHVVSYVFRGQRNGVVDSFAGGVAVAAVFGGGCTVQLLGCCFAAVDVP